MTESRTWSGRRLTLWALVTGFGVVVVVLVVTALRSWHASAYDDIRAARDAWQSPAEWTLTSEAFAGSKRFTLLPSDTRQAVLNYETDQTGPEACAEAREALEAFSGTAVTFRESGPTVGPGNFCNVAVDGDFHSIQLAFIWVKRVNTGPLQYEDRVGRIEVVLQEPVD